VGRIKGDLLRVGNTRRDWCSGRAWWLGARGGGVPGRERTYHLRRRCPMVKREAGMEEEDEGAVVHDFRAQARARASPSSTELWHSTERVHLTRASWACAGAGVTLAWSLGQPRHLFVFGFHGATWTRENSASGRVEVKVGVGASWDGIRSAVAPNAGVSQGSGTARHCLRAAAPNQALRGKRGQPRLFTLLRLR